MPVQVWAPLTMARVTATPSDVEEGSCWVRTDHASMEMSDGLPGLPIEVGPTGNLPVIRATAWQTMPPTGSIGSANFPADRLFALPFYPGRKCTLTGIAANVTLALIGGNIRFGIYLSDGAVPTTLLADYGTVGVGLTGVRSVTGLSTPVRPVLHFLVIARQGGVLNLGLTSRDTGDASVSETTPTFGAGLNSYYRDTVPGALPASFGAIAGTINSPAVAVQLT